MDFLKKLFNQQPEISSLTIILVGNDEIKASLAHLENSVKQTLLEMDRADIGCFTAMFDLAAHQPNNENLFQFVSCLETPVLLLLLIDLPSLLIERSPNAGATKIIQVARSLQTYTFLKKFTKAPHAQNMKPRAVIPIILAEPTAPAVAVARLITALLNSQGYSAQIATKHVGNSYKPTINLRERWAPMSVAVLAAGKSSRMGRPKQLEPVDGQPMVIRAVTTALRSGATKVLLVTGAYADDVNELLYSMALTSLPPFQIIHNPDYAEGQATSVHTVINHLLKATDTGIHVPQLGAVTFMPVDQPYLNPLLLSSLFRLWREGAQLAAPSVGGVPRGAPALFDRSLWPHINRQSGDVGAKALLHQFSEQLVTIDSPKRALFDIDTPDDLIMLA